MAVAASLFYNPNDSEKNTLFKRIKPSETQIAEQQQRWKTLQEYLIKDLGRKTDYTIASWLQGSYKFATQIRPSSINEEFDIDLGLYFLMDGKPEESAFNYQSWRNILQDSLQTYADINPLDIKEVTSIKSKCCRICYKNNFHIDIPIYHLNPRLDKRSLATEDGWENSDPKLIYKWFKKTLEEGGRAKIRRIIAYIKMWAGLKFDKDKGRPSSILLTVLITEVSKFIDMRDKGDDELLNEILEKMIHRLQSNYIVINPVDHTENLTRLSFQEMELFLGVLQEFYNISSRAIRENNNLDAAHIWTEAFQHFFPMPIEEYPEIGIRKNLPRIISVPEIKITAKSKKNPNIVYTNINEICPIPKNCSIEFEILNAADLPLASEIIWIVRNEGLEAEEKNDLGHKQKNPNSFKVTENSAYRGNHFMDCTIMYLGRVYSFRRIEIQITGNDAPLRNPSSRPLWNNLRNSK